MVLQVFSLESSLVQYIVWQFSFVFTLGSHCIHGLSVWLGSTCWGVPIWVAAPVSRVRTLDPHQTWDLLDRFPYSEASHMNRVASSLTHVPSSKHQLLFFLFCFSQARAQATVSSRSCLGTFWARKNSGSCRIRCYPWSGNPGNIDPRGLQRLQDDEPWYAGKNQKCFETAEVLIRGGETWRSFLAHSWIHLFQAVFACGFCSGFPILIHRKRIFIRCLWREWYCSGSKGGCCHHKSMTYPWVQGVATSRYQSKLPCLTRAGWLFLSYPPSLAPLQVSDDYAAHCWQRVRGNDALAVNLHGCWVVMCFSQSKRITKLSTTIFPTIQGQTFNGYKVILRFLTQATCFYTLVHKGPGSKDAMKKMVWFHHVCGVFSAFPYVVFAGMASSTTPKM